MKFATFASTQAPEELMTMRKAVARLANRLGLDLSDAVNTRRCLDGDFSGLVANDQLAECHELRDMLILLLRLESGSSEDIGIDGLRRLWQLQRELMNRFYMREPLRVTLMRSFQAV